ncbi:unnamed protein product [Bemisia tabaci]|uniref:Uncharacterized protein n=1 Tax=Bemisia tabaci TaxID=7038 RepID=A0A9P0AIE3_BEMTA|nr:unnamed protein product [Bemisia tabaci]
MNLCLISASTEVILTVQQRPAASSTMRATSIPTSPTGGVGGGANNAHSHTHPHPRGLQHHHSAPARDHITGPKPVDVEKQRQVECQRVHTLRLMLEKEQRYVEALRSELAKCSDPSSEPKIVHELQGPSAASRPSRSSWSISPRSSPRPSVTSKSPTCPYSLCIGTLEKPEKVREPQFKSLYSQFALNIGNRSSETDNTAHRCGAMLGAGLGESPRRRVYWAPREEGAEGGGFGGL